jgi:hypothetical protein
MSGDPGPMNLLTNAFAAVVERQRQEQVRRQAERLARAGDVARRLFIRGDGDRSKVDTNDPIQNPGRNDCFLIAAMAAVVAAHPDADRWLREALRPNPDGSFTLTVYDHGTPRQVTIDAEEITHPAMSNDARETWPGVLELGYARAFPNTKDPSSSRDGSYGMMGGGHPGEAMARLTGQPSQSLDMRKISLETFADLNAQGFAIVANTHHALPSEYFKVPATHPAYQRGGLERMREPDAPPLVNSRNRQLVQWHSYVVSGVDVAKGTVTLHNVQDTTRDRITIPYGLFQNGFASVDANPVVARSRPR